MSLVPVAQQNAFSIGPYATENDLKGSRHIIPYVSNKTASYVPNIFLGSGIYTPERNRDGSLRLEQQFCAMPVDRLRSMAPGFNFDDCSIEKLIQEDIKNHVEMRLQLFLIKLMALYQSGIKVKQFRTQDQAGDMNKSSGYHSSAPTEAHADTVPNLLAYSEEEENSSFFSDQTDLAPRVFAKGTSFYNQANITHLLPEFVNQVDSEIDFQTKELHDAMNTFRAQAVAILNLASTDKKMTPQIAFNNFLLRLRKKVNMGPNTLVKVIVRSDYIKVIDSYLLQNRDPNFIKRLMFDPNLEYPAISQTLRNRIQCELILADKISQIEQACDQCCTAGAYHHEDIIRCVLTLGTEGGRLALLQSKINDWSSTQKKYHDIAIAIPPVHQTAEAIIRMDPFLQWADWGANEVPYYFTELVKNTIKDTCDTNMHNPNEVALKILYTTAQRMHATDGKLARLLCLSTEEARVLMDSQSVRDYVHRCLKNDRVKQLLNEFSGLLSQLPNYFFNPAA